MVSGLDQAAEQALANLSALPHYSSFGEHRRALTSLALAAAPPHGEATLCVLGAGNCFDLDLDTLVTRYASVHLVDLDTAALERAVARHEPATRDRLVLTAPVDLSGLLDRIDRWSRFQVTPEELLGHADATVTELVARIARSFDVVLSACMLSQMQLSVLNVLTDRHPLFEAVRWTLNLTHFRTLAALTRRSGSALLATDISSGQLLPPDSFAPNADYLALVARLSREGNVFDFADPKRLAALMEDDPVLHASFGAFDVKHAWLWSNGPDAKFLVYASELRRL